MNTSSVGSGARPAPNSNGALAIDAKSQVPDRTTALQTAARADARSRPALAVRLRRQSHLLAKALVEHPFGHEPPQDAHLPCHLTAGVSLAGR